MAEEKRPEDRASSDPTQEHEERPATDPAAEHESPASTQRSQTTIVDSGGRSGIIIAAVIAVVAIIAAIIAMNWDWADPQATQMPADPAAIEEGAPATGDDAAPAPADDGAAAPADDAVEPVQPAD
jgi:hypothetical protein